MHKEIQKRFYTIAEVGERYGFELSKLRYWETVFPMLKPQKRGGERFYSQNDLEVLDEIVYLVEKKKHKLDAARQIMATGRSNRRKINQARERLLEIKAYLVEIKEFAHNPPEGA
ncbi:MAG: MerR family transcriptional regulator [Spirosomaceae bacterium]|jgi:DNA-binding transcriptional MerR regulator|nr:MerR family transcriptional regulator [Spirosomataceae bacterium]